ncbi:MAG: heavy metal translocating P-type ATPase [Acidimicrobiia bacterium]|nr:heavy metal translocating P-type ATPase [Acidimicrobiia bacterium]
MTTHDSGHGDDHGGGHDDHAAVFRRRFWIHLVLAVPILASSPTIQDWFGFSPPSFPGDDMVAPVLGTVVFLHGGWTFLAGARDELADRSPGMMTLIALAITTAFGASLLGEFGIVDLEFWWELAALIVVMLLGHWQEMAAVGRARSALEALAELLPDDAEVVEDGGTRTVPITDLETDMVVLVRPGSRVPADGVIVDGEAGMDESMITGESKPEAKGEGDEVAAGTVATDSAIRVRVTAVGDDTALAGIQRLVEEAQASGSRAQRLADRAAAVLFYVAVGAAAVTLPVWLVVGDGPQAIGRTVTVLVIACPHALGLAIPLVVALATGVSARQGILVRDRMAVERMREVDVVLFDKTGTLTLGEHEVAGVAAIGSTDADTILRLAAAAEGDSEHPLARAIVARAADLDVPEASDFSSTPGRGVQATVEGAEIAVGGPQLLEARALEIPADLAEDADAWRDRGAAVLAVVRDGSVVGVIALEDALRPEAAEAVDLLHDAGVSVSLITGDARSVAERVADDLGIDEVHAEVLPEDKDVVVGRLQDEGRVVAMVGDGVNDAPALARADVGIAIGAGTDVAIESAGIVLASDDPRAVDAVRRLSEHTYRKMRQNLAWAAGYNVAAIPLAAGVAAPLGFVLPPAVGALLMSASTVIVALNAQLLRRVDLSPGAA